MKARVSDPKKIQADLLKNFSKPEVLKVAKWCGLDVTAQTKVLEALPAIFELFQTNGVPDYQDAPELVLGFLYSAEVIDEEGNQIDFVTDAVEVTLEDAKKLECFGLGEQNDPACRRCKAMALCIPYRVSNRPSCFGQYFDAQADECKICIEASYCKQETNNR